MTGSCSRPPPGFGNPTTTTLVLRHSRQPTSTSSHHHPSPPPPQVTVPLVRLLRTFVIVSLIVLVLFLLVVVFPNRPVHTATLVDIVFILLPPRRSFPPPPRCLQPLAPPPLFASPLHFRHRSINHKQTASLSLPHVSTPTTLLNRSWVLSFLYFAQHVATLFFIFFIFYFWATSWPHFLLVVVAPIQPLPPIVSPPPDAPVRPSVASVLSLCGTLAPDGWPNLFGLQLCACFVRHDRCQSWRASTKAPSESSRTSLFLVLNCSLRS